jgi:hypothetical protein
MDEPCTYRLPGDGEDHPGRLTTEHAASSYGLPVVVAEDGTAYGCAEVEEVRVADAHAAVAALNAGYEPVVLMRAQP